MNYYSPKLCKKMTQNECPICMDNIGVTNCVTTECGHCFHAKCLFTNMNRTAQCPLCRNELVEYENSDSDSESDSESDNEEANEEKINITANQVLQGLKKKGISELDLINYMLEHIIKSDTPVSKFALIETLLDDVVANNFDVDYRDSRTYAAVLRGVTANEVAGLGPNVVVSAVDYSR